jgi:FkbM family methyltransferase
MRNKEILVEMSGRVRNIVSTLIKWWRAIGALSTTEWLLIRINMKLGILGREQWHVLPRQVPHALTARLRGSSDLNVFTQIFVQEEYRSLRSLENVALVLDLGANVGYSSAYFLSCFPKARVMAVEPDERNVEICRINVKPYEDRVLLMHGAVWDACTELCLSKGAYGDGREWATQVLEPHGSSLGDVQAWDVSSLIDMTGSEDVDLLKVDIEGAELVVFGATAKTWLPRVRNICIELHGPECREAFFNALADFDYELEYSGELTICKDIRSKTVWHCPEEIRYARIC